MKIHLISGFLGSGKTTAIQHAVNNLQQQGIKTGIVTNDQGIKQVDNDFFMCQQIPVRQVQNGCFCCNYNDLDACLQSLITTEQSSVIFAESVGSCTDIVATVVKPLLKYQQAAAVTLSTFADVRLLQMIMGGGSKVFDDTVHYIYAKQLEEAGIIVVNKIDLISTQALQTLQQLMPQKYPGKTVLYQNSFDEENIAQWLHTLDTYTTAATLPSLQLDYDVYAAGEAKLAWLDEEVEIYSAANNAMQETEDLINAVYKKISAQRLGIGHLKFLINGVVKLSFTRAAQATARLVKQPASSAALLINLRVEALPEKIKEIIAEAIYEVETQTGCTIIVNSLSAFAPGYPRPTHRM